MLALADKLGPFIVLMHSQGGPIGWAIADARPDLVKAIIAVEPNGPPGHALQFVGAPEWFKDGAVELPYGLTSTPIAYAPAVTDPAGLNWVREDKADAPDLAVCWKQAEPARQLTNLKMPIAVVTSEASVSRAL